jgi:hypothetical protein
VTPIAAEDREVRAAWRLAKADGTAYDVHLDGHGVHCTCPDHVFKHEGRPAGPCKHGRALIASGLLPVASSAPAAPAPVELPDGRVIDPEAPDGGSWDQDPDPTRFDRPAEEPPVIERPDPRSEDLDAAEPWYRSAPYDPELDEVSWTLSDAEADALAEQAEADRRVETLGYL